MPGDTQADWDEIYDSWISPQLFRNSQPSPAPHAVLIGGQPGAGKTRAAEAWRPPGGVAIIGDDLRVFHPDYDHLMTSDHLAMPAATADASGYWVRRAIREAAERGVSVVVEGTFRRPETTLATAAELHHHGFEVEVVAVAVSPEVSRLGTVTRYLEHDEPRWTPHAAHEVALSGVPATLRACEEEIGHTIASVKVVDREARLLTEVPAAGPRGSSATESFLNAQDQPLDSTEVEVWLLTWRGAVEEMHRRDLVNDITSPTLDRLTRDADQLLAAGTPPDNTAR